MKATSKADGRSARWDAHRLARRAELVSAAMVAVERHGALVGMDQIAASAGTSKAVFYRHFADKADLYRAVGQQLAQSLGDQLSARMSSQTDPRAMMAAGIDVYLSVLEHAPEVYRFVVHNPVVERAGGDPVGDYIQLISGRVSELINELFSQWPSQGPIIRPWGSAIVGCVKAAGDWWLDNPDVMTRAELTESLTTLLWGGGAGIQQLAESAASKN